MVKNREKKRLKSSFTFAFLYRGFWGFIFSSLLHVFHPHPGQWDLESGFGVPDGAERYTRASRSRNSDAAAVPSICSYIFKKKNQIPVIGKGKHRRKTQGRHLAKRGGPKENPNNSLGGTRAGAEG